MTDIIGTAVT